MLNEAKHGTTEVLLWNSKVWSLHGYVVRPWGLIEILVLGGNRYVKAMIPFSFCQAAVLVGALIAFKSLRILSVTTSVHNQKPTGRAGCQQKTCSAPTNPTAWETPATRNEATRHAQPPKVTPFAELTIGTAIRPHTVARERLRTVANINAASSEHTLNPQTSREDSLRWAKQLHFTWEWTMMKQWVAKVKGWNKVEYLHVNEAVLSHHGTRQSRVPVWWGLMHFPGCLISRDHQTTSWKSKSQRARQFIFDNLCKLGNMGKRGQGVSKGFSKTSDTTWSTTKSSNGDPTRIRGQTIFPEWNFLPRQKNGNSDEAGLLSASVTLQHFKSRTFWRCSAKVSHAVSLRKPNLTVQSVELHNWGAVQNSRLVDVVGAMHCSKMQDAYMGTCIRNLTEHLATFQISSSFQVTGFSQSCLCARPY